MTPTQLTDMQEAATGVAALLKTLGNPDRLLLLCQLSQGSAMSANWRSGPASISRRCHSN